MGRAHRSMRLWCRCSIRADDRPDERGNPGEQRGRNRRPNCRNDWPTRWSTVGLRGVWRSERTARPVLPRLARVASRGRAGSFGCAREPSDVGRCRSSRDGLLGSASGPTADRPAGRRRPSPRPSRAPPSRRPRRLGWRCLCLRLLPGTSGASGHGRSDQWCWATVGAHGPQAGGHAIRREADAGPRPSHVLRHRRTRAPRPGALLPAWLWPGRPACARGTGHPSRVYRTPESQYPRRLPAGLRGPRVDARCPEFHPPPLEAPNGRHVASKAAYAFAST